MPINISVEVDEDTSHDDKPKSVAWLCENSWELPVQLDELERWLENEGSDLPSGSYIADIGFSQRDDASGGGGTLSVSTMSQLVKLGMEIWLSEYRAETPPKNRRLLNGSLKPTLA